VTTEPGPRAWAAMAELTDPAAAPEVVMITGMSGAGRSTAAKSLEDMGWFVADNLPPGLLPTMVDLAARAKGNVPKIAVVVDVRSRAFSTDLESVIGELQARGTRPVVVFLEALDDTLVRRFENVRRPHPLQPGGRIIDGITAEREQLQELRAAAHMVLDTSGMSLHDLRARMRDEFGGEGGSAIRVTVLSFGYKYGLPVDADMVADCRFLPNPYWIPELAPLTGLDASVRDYVLGQPAAGEFLRAYTEAVRITLAGYENAGKQFMTLAVGCTGGKHRSVVIASEIAARLAPAWAGVRAAHRDLGRE
jgi:UPF0042 nucleotide-binding protein